MVIDWIIVLKSVFGAIIFLGGIYAVHLMLSHDPLEETEEEVLKRKNHLSWHMGGERAYTNGTKYYRAINHKMIRDSQYCYEMLCEMTIEKGTGKYTIMSEPKWTKVMTFDYNPHNGLNRIEKSEIRKIFEIN